MKQFLFLISVTFFLFIAGVSSVGAAALQATVLTSNPVYMDSGSNQGKFYYTAEVEITSPDGSVDPCTGTPEGKLVSSRGVELPLTITDSECPHGDNDGDYIRFEETPGMLPEAGRYTFQVYENGSQILLPLYTIDFNPSSADDSGADDSTDEDFDSTGGPAAQGSGESSGSSRPIRVGVVPESPPVPNRGQGNLANPKEIMGSIAQNRARYSFTIQKAGLPTENTFYFGLYLHKADLIITRTGYEFTVNYSEGPDFSSIVSIPLVQGALLASEGEESFLVSLQNLKPGTEYRFFIKDLHSDTSSSTVSFTTGTTATTAVGPDAGPQLPDATGATGASGPYLPGQEPAGMYQESLRGVLDIRFRPEQQTITETSITIGAEVEANIPVPVSILVLQYGSSLTQIAEHETELWNGGLTQGVPKLLTHTISGLAKGEGVYFRIKDTTRNLESTPLYVETKGGTGTAIPAGVQQIRDTTPAGPVDYTSGFTVNNPYEETGLVPCFTKASGDKPCTFDDFLTLVGNVIDYLLILLVPATAVVCIFAGIVSRGDATKLAQAKELLLKVLIASAVVMLSWTIIATVYTALGVTDKAYVLLDIFG